MSDNAEFYDRFASAYDRYYGHIDARALVNMWQEILARQEVPMLPSDNERSSIRMLDLGCGTGSNLAEWLRLGYRVDGLDASLKMLRLAAAKTSSLGHVSRLPRLYCADVRNPDQIWKLSGTYQLIVAHLNFLYLFGAIELEHVFASISRMLETGGRFVTDLSDFDEAEPPCTSKRGIDAEPTECESESRAVQKSWALGATLMTETYWIHDACRIINAARKQGLGLEGMISLRQEPEAVISVSKAISKLLIFMKFADPIEVKQN